MRSVEKLYGWTPDHISAVAQNKNFFRTSDPIFLLQIRSEAFLFPNLEKEKESNYFSKKKKRCNAKSPKKLKDTERTIWQFYDSANSNKLECSASQENELLLLIWNAPAYQTWPGKKSSFVSLQKGRRKDSYKKKCVVGSIAQWLALFLTHPAAPGSIPSVVDVGSYVCILATSGTHI